jgi:hypothetical protein
MNLTPAAILAASMTKSARFLPLFILVFAAWSAGVRAEDWPQFRGPGGEGHSTEKNLPLEWGEGRNVAWRTPVPGRGWSSPVIAAGRVWLTTAVDDSGGVSLRALAFDVATWGGTRQR